MNNDVSPRRRALSKDDAEPFVFRLHDLPELRDLVAARARAAGVAEGALGDLLVAVNEVATNAVTHGGVRGRLRAWRTTGLFFVEIHDDGHWTPDAPPGGAPPGDFATSGMGLWVASLLSEVIHFDYGARGTTVTMGFRV